jgi:hypothetical protein
MDKAIQKWLKLNPLSKSLTVIFQDIMTDAFFLLLSS